MALKYGMVSFGFFFLVLILLNYESTITCLQETWKIQNKVTCSSTVEAVLILVFNLY